MARRLKQRRRRNDGPVRGVELKTRRLVELGPGSEVWAPEGAPVPDVRDAIVWLVAPGDAPAGAEARVRDALQAAGALRVKVLPRGHEPGALPAAAAAGEGPPDLEATEGENRALMRSTAEVMAREVCAGDELERVLAALDESLTEAGL